MKRRLVVFTCCLFAGCATTNKGDIDTLKPSLDIFHREMRWKNIRTMAERLTPEHRDAFVKASAARDDETNLFVTDYTLEDCQVKADDQMEAVCFSTISWYRLPSTKEVKVTVMTTLKWQGGQWLIDRQSDGPFAQELSLGAPAPK